MIVAVEGELSPGKSHPDSGKYADSSNSRESTLILGGVKVYGVYTLFSTVVVWIAILFHYGFGGEVTNPQLLLLVKNITWLRIGWSVSAPLVPLIVAFHIHYPGNVILSSCMLHCTIIIIIIIIIIVWINSGD